VYRFIALPWSIILNPAAAYQSYWFIASGKGKMFPNNVHMCVSLIENLGLCTNWFSEITERNPSAFAISAMAP
jgi:hypothetical protein